MSYEEQKGYLSRHPLSRRKITARPDGESKRIEPEQEEKPVEQETEPKETSTEPIGKIDDLEEDKTKIVDMFKPLFKKHEDYLREVITNQYANQRKKFLEKYPAEQFKDRENFKKKLAFETLLNDYPDSKELRDHFAGRDSLDDYSFKDSKILKQFPIKDRSGNLGLYVQFGKAVYDKDAFDTRVDKVIDDSIEANESKLLSAIYQKLEGLDIKSVNEIHSNIGRQGIEGMYKVQLADGTIGRMSTKSIYACGYNIQVLHYRYLINIDPTLDQKKVIKEKPLFSKSQEEKFQKANEKLNLEKAKKIAGVFSEIKRAVKDWNGIYKDDFKRRVDEGSKSSQEYEETKDKFDKLQKFLSKHQLKREEITQKVLNGEMDFSVFDEVDHLLTKGWPSFYDYERLKKNIHNYPSASAPAADSASQETKIKNIFKENLPDDFDIRNPIPKDIKLKIEDLPGGSKNFQPYMKLGLMYKLEDGHWAVKRYKYYLTQKGLAFFRS